MAHRGSFPRVQGKATHEGGAATPPGAQASISGTKGPTLPGDALDHVARLAVPRRYERGRYVFLQGQAGDALYVVAEGLVKVFVVSEEEGTSVNQILRSFERDGYLELEPRRVVVRRLEALQERGAP